MQNGQRVAGIGTSMPQRGQTFVDPVTGKPNTQAFGSSTRFEMYLDPHAEQADWLLQALRREAWAATLRRP